MTVRVSRTSNALNPRRAWLSGRIERVVRLLRSQLLSD